MVDPELLAAHARCMPSTRQLQLGAPPAGVLATPALEYRDEARLRAEVFAYAQQLGTSDVRAAGSIWAKYYIGALVPGVVALMTLEGLGIDASAARVRIECRDGHPHAAWLDDPRAIRCAPRTRTPAEGAPCKTTDSTADLHEHVLRPLLNDHLGPMFEALERACGLWRGVPWNSAGNSLAWYLDEWAKVAPEAALEDRRALLEDASSPLHDPVTHEDLHEHGLTRRIQVRRACCLRYRLPDTQMCYTCPQLSSLERATLIRRSEARG